MQLRLVEDDPSAWAAATTVERTTQLDAERRRRARVRLAGTRRQPELAVDDLGDYMLRRAQHVFVGCALLRRIRHTRSLPYAFTLRIRAPTARSFFSIAS